MRKNFLTAGFFIAICTAPLTAQTLPHVDSPLQLQTSDPNLQHAFDWAKRQALDYAFPSGTDPVGPWYEAALPGREAFCMRDTSHQAMGAQALGLAPYTHNMLRKFAESISDKRDWCGYWEIDRYDRPAPVDYKNDQQFWFNLPANFDILDCCYRMYLWTGDQTYLTDPIFNNFYDKTVNDYVDRWDLGIDKIMHRDRHKNIPPELAGEKVKFGFNRGIPGYQESNATYAVALDVLASQYAAYRSYARIQELKGNPDLAADFFKRADSLKSLIETNWWDDANKHFFARVNKDFTLEGSSGTELLYWNIPVETPKLQSTVDQMLSDIQTKPTTQVEGQSHRPELLYHYGQPDLAYAQLLQLTAEKFPRREYPEASFSAIGAIVTGTFGITVEPTSPQQSEKEGNYVDRAVKTLPALTKETPWAELSNLPIRANTIAVRHEGITKTTFTNQHGPALIWQASFTGAHDNLLVNGEPMKTHQEPNYLNQPISWVRIPVGAGDSVTVEASPNAQSPVSPTTHGAQ